MKTSLKILFASVFILSTLSCNAKPPKKNTSTQKIEVITMYYFHYTARCITCKTLEEEAQKDVETLYPNLYKAGKIVFQSINLNEPTGEALAEKLKVAGQTLLIVKGNQQINLTNEGFLYCRSDAEKFKAIIKEKMDALIK